MQLAADKIMTNKCIFIELEDADRDFLMLGVQIIADG